MKPKQIDPFADAVKTDSDALYESWQDQNTFYTFAFEFIEADPNTWQYEYAQESALSDDPDATDYENLEGWYCKKPNNTTTPDGPFNTEQEAIEYMKS